MLDEKIDIFQDSIDETRRIFETTSVDKDIRPFLKYRLQTIGYALLSYYNNSIEENELEKELLSVILLLGRDLGSSVAYHTLKEENKLNPLEVHVECIYALGGINSYCALACLQPAASGGETKIFDGRKAAVIIEQEYPEIANVAIEYSSSFYPGQTAKYPLIYNDEIFGKTLRFRSQNKGDIMRNIPEGYTANDIYNIVEDVLTKCLILNHSWKKGDILFFNNRITLHSRNPYRGYRSMLRVRFDDPNNIKLTY